METWHGFCVALTIESIDVALEVLAPCDLLIFFSLIAISWYTDHRSSSALFFTLDFRLTVYHHNHTRNPAKRRSENSLPSTQQG